MSKTLKFMNYRDFKSIKVDPYNEDELYKVISNKGVLLYLSDEDITNIPKECFTKKIIDKLTANGKHIIALYMMNVISDQEIESYFRNNYKLFRIGIANNKKQFGFKDLPKDIAERCKIACLQNLDDSLI